MVVLMSEYKGQLKTAIYSMIVLAVLSFIASIPLAVSSNNYSSIQAVYSGILLADLLRQIALFCSLIAVSLYSVPWLKVRVEFVEQKYLMIFFMVVFSGALLYSSLTTIQDLIAKCPAEITGKVIDKKEVHLLKGSVEFHVRIDTSKQDFTMIGDNSLNGFDEVKVGEYVKIFYGENTKQIFLIRKANL